MRLVETRQTATGVLMISVTPLEAGACLLMLAFGFFVQGCVLVWLIGKIRTLEKVYEKS